MNQLMKQYGQFIVNMGTIVAATSLWALLLFMGYHFLIVMSRG
jgi:hypothetical protein